MTPAVAITLVLLVMVAVNVWVHLGPRRLHLVTGPLASLLLLVIGRMAGLSWEQLGLAPEAVRGGALVGGAAAAAVAIGYAVALAIPFTRAAFRDTRYRIARSEALYLSLVAIPLGTVLFEEVAFRGVLWGLLSRDVGALGATVVSACAFGVWHVLPALDLALTNASVQWRPTAGRSRLAITILATAVFTTVAGIIFAELRWRSGSLVAPICLHWTTNGLGVQAAARVWATSPDKVATPDASASLGPVGQPAFQRILRKLWPGRSR
jgi:membrane protease YdiL (CAAX protease family)